MDVRALMTYIHTKLLKQNFSRLLSTRSSRALSPTRRDSLVDQSRSCSNNEHIIKKKTAVHVLQKFIPSSLSFLTRSCRCRSLESIFSVHSFMATTTQHTQKQQQQHSTLKFLATTNNSTLVTRTTYERCGTRKSIDVAVHSFSSYATT